MNIWTVEDKNEEQFLRVSVKPFNFSSSSLRERRELVRQLRQAMKQANGVGLSANQVGSSARVFVARVENKFYTVFNPEITKSSADETTDEEGCLSVPALFGQVPRANRVVLTGQDAAGKRIKIKAWGLLARVVQHEVDHLNGVLFLDRAERVYEIVEKSEVK